jgi:hypothetical protein
MDGFFPARHKLETAFRLPDCSLPRRIAAEGNAFPHPFAVRMLVPSASDGKRN